MRLECFKSYDIRGRIGETLDEDIARRIGSAFAEVMKPDRVVVGHDARESSPRFKAALVDGLVSAGVDVADIGLCGTEEVYFATGHLGTGGGIMVTASHNPIDYNGMKLVGPGARPIDPEGELATIRAAAEADAGATARRQGRTDSVDTRPAYTERVAGFLDANNPRRPLRIVANAGNGTAGAAFDSVASALGAGGAKLEITRVHHDPDATFPNGIPNPLLPANRASTSDAVIAAGADLGLAWDGDFDRCFFFDETGAFVDGEYVVALLAQAMLAVEPGARIVHDPRVVWATTTAVAEAGGEAVVSKTGHAFLKAKMRETGAVYGGEMSAHHYFRDFYCCDSGMIPWVLMLNLLLSSGKTLSQLLSDLRARFPSSGEINFRVPDAAAAMAAVEAHYGPEALETDRLDGLSLVFADWRLNLRASNTEPLLRLNLETRGDRPLLEAKRDELAAMLSASQA